MKTVFLVDDDRSLREVMSRRLQKQFVVRAFASPHAVLPDIVTGGPDLVISDVQMPGMSGLELAETVRQTGNSLPIILITGFLTPEVEEKARRLSVDHVLQKPIKDYGHFTSLISESISSSNGANRVDLDRLRLGFLAELSHELRTPLTAIKLALDGLFGQHVSALPPAERRLAIISQRNVDRIVHLVEKQLDLLQIIVGDVAVSNRLVDIRDVVEDAAERSRRRIDGLDRLTGADRYLFTDTDRLRAVVDHILDCVVDGKRIEVLIGEARSPSDIVLEFRNADLSRAARGNNGGSSSPDVPAAHNGEGSSFEVVASHRVIHSLGGQLRVRNVDGGECVCLRLPVLPEYDKRADFVIPVRGMRRAALLSNTRYSFLRCEIAGSGEENVPESADREFFRRCLLTFTEGDALIRGKRKGTYYIALLDRTSDEIDNVLDRVGSGMTFNEVSDDTLEAALMRTLLPGEPCPDVLLFDAESAR